MKNNHFNHELHQYTTNYKEAIPTRFIERVLNAFFNLQDIDAYVFDYQLQEIIYVTPGSRLLKGSNTNKTLPLRFDYYEKVVHKEDIALLETLNQTGFDFFYKLPLERRLDGYITYDFRLRNEDGRYVIVNHKLAPLNLTESGVIHLSLCIISESTHDTTGNAFIKMNDSIEVYEFLPGKKRFVEVVTQKLSPKAYQVLTLAAKGKTAKEIADSMRISLSTVKYHKTEIFQRIGVKNTTEAIQWLNNQKKGF